MKQKPAATDVCGALGLAVRAISWVSSKWRHRAPAGKVLLRAFFGGALGPE